MNIYSNLLKFNILNFFFLTVALINVSFLNVPFKYLFINVSIKCWEINHKNLLWHLHRFSGSQRQSWARLSWPDVKRGRVSIMRWEVTNNTLNTNQQDVHSKHVLVKAHTSTRASRSLAKSPEVSPATSFSRSFLNTAMRHIGLHHILMPLISALKNSHTHIPCRLS